MPARPPPSPQVRSADVLVIVHGSGGSNSFYMREGSAHLEVRPFQFGTKYAVRQATHASPTHARTLAKP